MAKWIECTGHGTDHPVWVNIDNVAYMTADEEQTVIIFRDGLQVSVLEHPVSILGFEDIQQGA